MYIVDKGKVGLKEVSVCMKDTCFRFTSRCCMILYSTIYRQHFPLNVHLCVLTAFKEALAEADYQRREYIRVKEGKAHEYHSLHLARILQCCLGNN